MKFSLVYSAALLLSPVGLVGSYPYKPTPASSRHVTKPESIETITIISWSTKDITEDDAEYWGADEILVRPKNIFSPTVVTQLLDSYTDLVQNAAVRSYHQLREAKAASRHLNSSREAFGDWWARRRWEGQVPEDETWFDGTLAEGLAHATSDAVFQDVHQLYEMGRLLDFGEDAMISDQTRNKLIQEAYRAINLLNAAANDHNNYVVPQMDAVVSRLVARARRLANNLEQFGSIVTDSILSSIYEGPSTNWAPRRQRMPAYKAANMAIQNVRNAVFPHRDQPESKALPSRQTEKKPADQVPQSLETQLINLYVRYVVDFLRDEDDKTNGTMVRNRIHKIYGDFRDGVEKTRGIFTQTDEMVIRANEELKENHQRPSTKWLVETVQAMATNLNRTNIIHKYSDMLITEADRFHNEFGKINAKRSNELWSVVARARGLEPGIRGREAKMGKRLQTGFNPETNTPIYTQYLYNYRIQAPWKSVEKIREAADRLEYVWSTLAWCEDELEYLNICWDVDTKPMEKREKLSQRFHRPGGRLNEVTPPCDSFANPLVMSHMCIDKYNFD
ncbi:hypothetical protein ABKA04_001300 [Annulohypoxylon sp. FPYF3050]